MKLGLTLWLTIALMWSGSMARLHKVDSLFSYRTPDTKKKSVAKAERNLVLGFGMSDEEKEEERRKESRKDDVKNLIKILQLADLFHDDPNFDVQVDIKFKNSANGGGSMALLNHLANARRLTQVDLKKMIAPGKGDSKVTLSNSDTGSQNQPSKPERRLVIDSHRSKIDMRKFQMPKNLY